MYELQPEDYARIINRLASLMISALLELHATDEDECAWAFVRASALRLR